MRVYGKATVRNI